jgi:WS/DGAT/MGAT family acyltransferase
MAGRPERLSPDDAAILALESSAIAGHTLKLLLLEAGGPIDIDLLRTAVAARLEGEPRAIERLEVESGGSAAWVEDERFDITAHVRERHGTAGIDEAALARVAGEIMAEHLDHSRPLWALDVVGPLDDGREALIVRIHHAMADGVSCMRFLDAVLWDVDEPQQHAAAGPSAGVCEEAPSWRAELTRLPGALLRELGHRARALPFDHPLGAGRALAFARVPLAGLKRIGHARPEHTTVNDVLLAAVAGGLREWLGAKSGSLRAQVPVSLHHADEAELGNRDSFLNVDLPLAEADPVARLDLIRAETSHRKELGDAEELYDFFHALGRVRPVSNAVERLCASPGEFSLSISNVPGPRGAVRVLDRRLEHLGTFAEPADRHVLRVSAVSCADTLAIGLCTDPDALAGVDELAAAIERAYAELDDATGQSNI